MFKWISIIIGDPGSDGIEGWGGITPGGEDGGSGIGVEDTLIEGYGG